MWNLTNFTVLPDWPTFCTAYICTELTFVRPSWHTAKCIAAAVQRIVNTVHLYDFQIPHINEGIKKSNSSITGITSFHFDKTVKKQKLLT